MEKIEFEFQGKGRDGDVLVVDGQLPNFRTEAMPAYAQTLPRAPRLEKDQRAVLVYDGSQVVWRVRQNGVSRGESAGTSLVMIIAVVVAYDKFKKWRDQKDQGD